MLLVGRIRDRATFDALRRSRMRASSGAVRLTFVPAASLPPRPRPEPEARVAYAVSRKVGGAVERNRVRRRARAVLGERDGAMMPGAYLISFAPGAAEMSFEELRSDVERALSRLEQRSPTGEVGRTRRSAPIDRRSVDAGDHHG